MKKCKMCGSFLSNTAKVCPKCGVACEEEIKIEEVKVEPQKSYDTVAPVSMENNESKEDVRIESGVKFCPSCGTKVKEDARFCPKCGKNFYEVASRPQTFENSTSVGTEKDLALINDEYSRKGTTNMVLAFVSLVLCCCGLLALVPFISSISTLKAMKNLSPEVKNTSEYRSVRNKHIIAIAVSAFVIFYFAIQVGDTIINFDEYRDAFNEGFEAGMNGNV